MAADNMAARGSELAHFVEINAGTQRLLGGVLALVNHTLKPYGENFAPAELVDLQGILRDFKRQLNATEKVLSVASRVLLINAEDMRERI